MSYTQTNSMNGKLTFPIHFIQNNGQQDHRAHFTAYYGNRRFFFASEGISVVELEHGKIQPDSQIGFDTSKTCKEVRNGISLELCFINGKAGSIPVGLSQQAGKYHYLKGNDSTKWQKDVPHYSGLRYSNVWNGIDLELHGGSDGIKMNWLLDSPTLVSSMRLEWAGADGLELDAEGNLLVHHSLGTLTDLAPIAYQEINGEKIPVTCSYHLEDDLSFTFELTGDCRSDLPLVIDPIIQFATYLGGSGDDVCRRIAVDSQGCAYVAGDTDSIDFPVTPGAFQTALMGDRNVFITKFAPDGESLVYSTYLGGSNEDTCTNITIDGQGAAYITGATTSTDFPTTPGAFQTIYAGGFTDGFVTKLAVDGGSLVYSTFLGGNERDSVNSIAVDSLDCAYVVGDTTSTDFPVTPGAFQTSISPGGGDGFITKFSVDGSSLIYSTYLGGDGDNIVADITVDSQGRAYIVGNTSSSDFPTTPGAYDTALDGINDGFVAMLSNDGGSLIYSTYLGGSGQEACYGIAINGAGEAYVTGVTTSPDFPTTPGAFQATFGGNSDAFIIKLAPGGDSLIASTYLGGSNEESGLSIVVDAQNHVYITGFSSSVNFPTTPEVLPSSLNGATDAIVSILSANLADLLVSYYLGGSGTEQGFGIALGPDGGVYTSGITTSTDFPVTPGAFQTVFGSGNIDGYVTKSAFVFYRQVSLTIQGLF